ncbi:hypothetical protein G6F56_005727 [Rhizopus delemar]|nr:hypothetical protein G6F56_005727 [Rhizopus delemar]
MYYAPESGPINHYKIYDPKASSVIHNYTLIIGEPRHPPSRHSFVYLASSIGYAESDDAQKKIEGFSENCKKYEIPCDGIHLSSEYAVSDKETRCVFKWICTHFPGPEGLAKTPKASGIHIFANMKPWFLKENHPVYDQLKQWRCGRNASYIDFTSQVDCEY